MCRNGDGSFKYMKQSIEHSFEKTQQGTPWQSSGWDSVLSRPRARVRSLVGELRCCEPRGAAKNKETNKQINKKQSPTSHKMNIHIIT